MHTNLAQLIEDFCNKNSKKTALHIRRIFRLDTYTYAQVWENTLKINTYLDNLNIHKGESILIWGPNMPEWVFVLFAAFVRGVKVIPINVNTETEIINKYIEQTQPKALFKSKFLHTDDFIKTEKVIILENLMDIVKNLSKTDPDQTISNNEIAEIVFTSGTTGTPKGVVITHKNIIFELEQLQKLVTLKNKRVLSILPLSHIMEQVIGLYLPLQGGSTINYVARLTPTTILKAFERYKITHAAIVPQILRVILENIEHKAKEQNKLMVLKVLQKIGSKLPLQLRKILFKPVLNKFGGKLEAFASGSAPLDVHVAKAWENMGIKVVEGYGASETAGAVTSNTLEKRLIGSVGTPLPNIEVTVNKKNELLVKGENVFQGYYNNLEKTNEVFKNEFYYTGDIGYFKNGYLYITGRSNFKIVTAAGDKVYPEDVEKMLNSHPLVKESCVLGIDKGDGEIVYASIVTKDTEKIDEIISSVNQNLQTHQKILEYGIWQSEEFPKTHTLKIDRNTVKSKVSSENSHEETQIQSIASKKEIDKLKELIAEVCKCSISSIAEDSTLVIDLDMDSLKRVALLALIEEEFSAYIDEALITEQTTVGELRKNVNDKENEVELEKFPKWLTKPWVVVLRNLIRYMVFLPLQYSYVKGIKIEGKENLKLIKNPSIIVFNHVGHYDSSIVVSSLPKEIRMKQFALGDKNLYNNKIQGFIMYLVAHAYPVDKTGKRVKKVLEKSVDLIEQRWSLLLSPEGGISDDGTLKQLKGGAAMLAVETGAPVIPFKIEGYRKIFPDYHKEINEFKLPMPKGRAKIILKVGKPITFDRKTSYEEASQVIFDSMKNL